MSGSSAATRAPKARMRMISVSGRSRCSPSALSRATTVRTSRSSGARPVTLASTPAPEAFPPASGARNCRTGTTSEPAPSPLVASSATRKKVARLSRRRTSYRRFPARRPPPGRSAGGPTRRAGCRAPGAGRARRTDSWLSRVTAKNSPIGRLKRELRRSSVRDASVSRSLPPRMLSNPGVAGARTTATAPIIAHTIRTTHRRRTSARANRSISFSGPSESSAPPWSDSRSKAQVATS